MSPEGPQTDRVAAVGSLQLELEAIRWIRQEVRVRRTLHAPEAEVVVRALYVAMHGSDDLEVPLVRSGDPGDYGVHHSASVAALSMALAEFAGSSRTECLGFGLAGLLSDIGSVLLPPELLAKQADLDLAERTEVQEHVLHGARLLVESAEPLELAAVVAYEHHLPPRGDGYPPILFPRPPHYASRLVRICDVFDVLTTARPHRNAWSIEQALSHLEEKAGEAFDADLARLFAREVRQLGDRLVIVRAGQAP